MSTKLASWIADNGVSEVECIVPDMNGVQRGKVLPAGKFLSSVKDGTLRIPGSIFCVTINGEYYYVPEGQMTTPYANCLAIGFEIETGGHVFQLHFTNSTGMFERAFITVTTGDFFDGNIHYGFNISRVFTLHDPKKKLKEKMKAEGK